MKNNLHLEGTASDPIWLMADGEEPYVIGIRLDCGDAGVVYVTREQAADLAQQLSHLLNQLGGLRLGENKVYLMNEKTMQDIELFLGKVVTEIAFRPTKDEAARLLTELRKDTKSKISKGDLSNEHK